LFALALFISFLGIAYALLHVGLSPNAVAAGATAAIVTAAIGWVVFRANRMIRRLWRTFCAPRGISAGHQED
jgi:hypothetical protein